MDDDDSMYLFRCTMVVPAVFAARLEDSAFRAEFEHAAAVAIAQEAERFLGRIGKGIILAQLGDHLIAGRLQRGNGDTDLVQERLAEQRQRLGLLREQRRQSRP